MKFEKWQALGNDYVIVEATALPFALTPARIRRICEPHFGVGADGILLLERTPPAGGGEEADGAVGTLRIFNPDGSEAELSGNGAREAALYMHAHGWPARETFTIDTAAGPIRPSVLAPGRCRIELGRASTSSSDYPGGPPDGSGEIEAGGLGWSFQHVSIGNPQCSIRVADATRLEALALGELGPPIESSHLFPNRTNVSWYAPLECGRIRARIFERGVGETLSSGTGAAGAAVAHVLARRRAREHDGGAGAAPATVTVVLDGGELEVEVGEGLEVAQSGFASAVFAGALGIEFLESLHATE
jgi:diaminopimelate epimerase